MSIQPLRFLFAACMLASTATYAQQENVDTAVFNKIRKAELTNSHIPQIAHYLTDVSGPRLTASPGYNRASNWAVETMKQWGLANAAREPWGTFGKQWELQDFSLTMKVPYPQPLRAYAMPWSANTNGTVQGEVVVISSSQQADTVYVAKHAPEWKGKFVLVAGGPVNTKENFKPSATRLTDSALTNMEDEDMLAPSLITFYKAYLKRLAASDRLMKDAGVLAFISATSASSINGGVFVQAFGAHKLSNPVIVPQVSMALEEGQRIKRLIASGHRVELAMNLVGKSYNDDPKGYNVVAEIPGTDPKLKSQLVMLGGHLDSWEAATGATDNAAGSVVMMEAMRLIDSLHLKPKRTIRIALWGGEEEGVLGSFGYVNNHFRDKNTYALKPEQSKVSVYFNLDNGTGKIRGIFAQNDTAVKPIFDKWFAPFADLGASTVTLKNSGSTDHLSFDWAGIPGFEFIQDPIDYEGRTHHTNLDDYDHLQIEDLKQAAIIVAAFVYQASIRPEMLPRKPLVKEAFFFDAF
jgi:carboxypeptidase Q